MKNHTLRLNLFFSLLNRRSAVYLVVYLIVLGLSYFFLSVNATWVVLAFPFVFGAYKIFFATKTLKFERDIIRFTYTHHVSTTGYRKTTVPVRVDYTVMNITKLKFEQNAIEKLFGAGHISFTGRTFENSSSIYSKNIDIKTSFTFYGLTDFNNTKKEICDILGVNETE